MKKKLNNHLDRDTNQEEISLGLAFKALLVISIAIVLLIVSAISLNKNRERKVIADYTTETQELMNKNQEEFEKFFTETFEECSDNLDEQPPTNLDLPSSRPSSMICPEAAEQLKTMGVHNLKDSSSIAYVVFHKNNLSQMIEASGKISRRELLGTFGRSSESEKPSLLKLYQSRTENPVWGDYVYYIAGKEVPVPIKIDGKVIGYILRGVVEK